jgi:hypothetical protein
MWSAEDGDRIANAEQCKIGEWARYPVLQLNMPRQDEIAALSHLWRSFKMARIAAKCTQIPIVVTAKVKRRDLRRKPRFLGNNPYCVSVCMDMAVIGTFAIVGAGF